AERLDDEEQARQREGQHRQAFLTATAVTLNSGWRDMGSTASGTVKLTRKAASKNAAKRTPCRGPAVTTALPVISLKRLRTNTVSPLLIPRAKASASLSSKWPRPEVFASSGIRSVMVPVCHCSSTRPVVSRKGKSFVGVSGETW